MASKSATIRVVTIALLIDLLAFTIILPLFPRILDHYRQRDSKDPNSIYSQIQSLITIFKLYFNIKGDRLDIILFGGLLGSLFSVLQFFSSPIIGALSDAYGRRTVLLLSMIGNALSMLLWIFSSSFGVFLASRIVGGLTEGNVQMSIAILADISTKKERSKTLAIVGICFAVAFTCGPPLGAYLSLIDLNQYMDTEKWSINSFSTPALFAFVLILIETLYMVF